MSDEGSGGSVRDLSSTSLGYIIAFLLPGLLSLFGLRYWSEDVSRFLQPALAAEASVGPSIIILLVALGLGIAISVLTGLVVEKALCRGSLLPEALFERLIDKDRLTLFKVLVDEHYRYCQFYGGTAIALAVVYTGWVEQRGLGTDRRFVSVTLGLILLVGLLLYAAKGEFESFVSRADVLTKDKSPTTTATADPKPAKE